MGLAVLAIVFLTMRARFVAKKASGEKRLADAKARLAKILDQIDDLKKRHQFLPYSDEDYSQPMSGQTLTLYNEFDQTLDQLREAWLAATEAKAQAESALQTVGFLSFSTLDEIEAHLDQADTQKADSLLEQCEAKLVRLEQAHEQAEKEQQDATDLIAQIEQNLGSLDERQLPRAPFEADLATGKHRVQQAVKLMAGNPLGTQQELGAAKSQLAILLDRTNAILDQAKKSDELVQRLDEIERDVQKKRDAGLRLTEENGNPDPHIAQGRVALGYCHRLLEQGDADEAAGHLHDASECVRLAQEAIDRQLEAKGYCEAYLQPALRRTQELKQGLAQCRRQYQQLENEFDPESWQDVAGSAGRAEALLGGAELMLTDAQALTEAPEQRYIQAADAVRHSQRQNAQVAGLFDGVDARLQQLCDLRERCRNRVSELNRQRDEARSWFDQFSNVVGREALNWFDTASQQLQSWQHDIDGGRPNWSALWQVQDRIGQALSTGMEHGRHDVERHEQLQQRLQETQSIANQVDMLLRSHASDRPRANRRFQRAQQELANLQQALNEPNGDWNGLLRRLDEAASDLENAKAWAQEDIRLAQQAAAEIADAEREIGQARSFYREGVSANVTDAERELQQARSQLSSQDYERAIETADRAGQSARNALAQAERDANGRVQTRQMQQMSIPQVEVWDAGSRDVIEKERAINKPWPEPEQPKRSDPIDGRRNN